MNSLIPRPEHPRPDLERATWLNLNGPWRFAFDPRGVGEHEGWFRPDSRRPKDQTIIVPFPWESRLSGVAAPDYKGAAWYEREITIPADWTGVRPYLHLGAVDWSARVWLDGRLVAEHANGYLPFTVDLGDYLSPGMTATVTIRANDLTDAATPLGKQAPRWFTPSSGIWQTVWLEARPADRVAAVRLTPDLRAERVRVALTLAITTGGEFTLRLMSPNDAFPSVERRLALAPGHQPLDLDLPVPAPRLWSPETPHLYTLAIDLTPAAGGPMDRVTTSFGMRSIGRARWAGREYESVMLNDEPVYLRGVLDQGYHPDGLHAYPSDDAIRADLELAKACGFNMVRCHLKVNEPRYYDWADRLGLLVMYDLPNCGVDTPNSRQAWEATLRGALARDHNHPSIVAWVLFNETWGLDNHARPDGQAWVRAMYELAKTLDPSRLVEDHSPCNYDHVATDLNSWHFYTNDHDQARRHVERVVAATFPGSPFNFVGGNLQTGQPLLNSEYGGVIWGEDVDTSWWKFLTNELRRHAIIGGFVYSELYDVEWEHYGVVDYDRGRKEFGYDAFAEGMSLTDLFGPDYIGVDGPPCETLGPGAEWRLRPFVSHQGAPLSGARLRWRLDFVDRFGNGRVAQSGDMAVDPARFDVTPAGDLRLRLPDEPGLATLVLVLEDAAGRVRCRNYTHAEVRAGASPRQERTPEGWAVRFAPGDYVASSWPPRERAVHGAKFAATGAGWVEYALDLPPDLPLDRLRRLRLRVELAARAGLAKVDWPQRARPSDYPQTGQRTFPSEVVMTLNGAPLGSARPPDDPADARGVLSHYHGFQAGSHGYLTELGLEGPALATVCAALATDRRLRPRFTVPVEADHPGGLALYGETLGRYPLDPTIFLDLE